MKNLQHFVLILSLSVLSGCVSVPTKTLKLSQDMGPMISASKRTNLALLDQWVAARRDIIDYRVNYVWAPGFIIKFLAKPKVKRAFKEKVCARDGGELDRAKVMQHLAEAITTRMYQRKKKWTDALEKKERKLRRRLRDFYSDLESANAAITANLHSIIRVQQIRDEVVNKLGLPTEKLLPMEQASSALNSLFSEEK